MNGRDDWKSAMDKARDMIEEGRKEMIKAAEMAKEKGDDAWQEAQEKASEAWKHARARGAEFWDDAVTRGNRAYKDARDLSEDALEDVTKIVKKHPTRAIGLALLMGVVIGSLMTRDRD